MNWNTYSDNKPCEDDEVVINTMSDHGKFKINVKCNCQYEESTNSWIILDPLYVKCGEDGKLKCKDNDLWCTKEDYRQFQREVNKAKRDAAKKKKTHKD